jgi:hypothetical protein
MTMLTPVRGPLEGARYPLRDQNSLRPDSAAAHLAAIRRLCLGVLAILLGGSAVAAIMALKIAAYLPRFIHH